MLISILKYLLEEQRPIGRFLLVSKEGPSGQLVKNFSPDGWGVKGGPFGPISKKWLPDGRGFNDALIVRFLFE